MERISTGDPQLDAVLHGGLPTGSFVVVAGAPGTGKSVLAQQIAFGSASTTRPALVYSSMSESVTKVRRHLGAFSFFDDERFGTDVRYLQLAEFAERARDGGRALDVIIDEIVEKTFATSPAVVIVDSSRSLEAFGSQSELRAATFRLASTMSHSGAVLLYVGEYDVEDAVTRPEFAVADVILELANEATVGRDRRTIRVAKLRGSDFVGGRHPLRLSSDGFAVRRRLESLDLEPADAPEGRAAFGDEQLNRMTDGGIPRGDAALLLGPAGAGKTTLAMHWVHAAMARGEPALIVALEESPSEIVWRADQFGLDFSSAVDEGLLRIVHASGGLAAPDDIAHDIVDEIADFSPRVAVVDAVTSLLPTLRREDRSPGFETALVALLRGRGMTALYLFEIGVFGGLTVSTSGLSHLANTVLIQRYMQRGSELGQVLSVLKMRRSRHDRGLLQYDITPRGLEVVGEADDVRDIAGWTVLGSPTA